MIANRRSLASPRLVMSLFALIALVVPLGRVADAQSRQPTRSIPRSPISPIPDLLKADDRVVVIRDYASHSGVDDEPVSLAKEIEWLIDSSDAIVVIDVTAVSGALTQDRMWVESRMVGAVVDLVVQHVRKGDLPPVPELKPGQTVNLRWRYGGEVTVGRVLVSAHPSQLLVGRRYLVSINGATESGELYPGPRFSVERGGRLRPIIEPNLVRQPPQSPIDGLRLADIVERIRRAAASR